MGDIWLTDLHSGDYTIYFFKIVDLDAFKSDMSSSSPYLCLVVMYCPALHILKVSSWLYEARKFATPDFGTHFLLEN